jgi:hypothetical protein
MHFFLDSKYVYDVYMYVVSTRSCLGIISVGCLSAVIWCSIFIRCADISSDG